MFQEISQFIQSENYENGLMLVDPNTGSGKTYWSCQAIYDYTHNSINTKKIYFTTTLLKNLPKNELKRAYKAHNNPNFESEVLVIKSNEDFVKENLLKTKVPEEYQEDAYKSLCSLIELVTDKHFSTAQPIYKEEIQKRFSIAERSFRKYLHTIIANDIKGTENEKKEKIRNDKRYQWIGKIYPTVFTGDYKIYLLSVSKFLRRNDTLVKPSYPFISTDVLKNTVIFIDEFDATKETVQNFIIEKAINTQNDYLDIVKELHGKLHDYRPAVHFYEPYRKYAENKPYLHTLESLQKETDSLYEKYALYFNYKTNDENIDRNRGFLFFDGSFRSYLKKNCHYIRTVIDKNTRQVKIYFETKEQYNDNKNPTTDINIYSLLRDVTSFLNSFARFIANWAEKYAKSENDKRKLNVANSETYTFENALHTICDIYFKNEHLNNILHDLVTSSALRNIQTDKTSIEDFSFYNRGFKFFEFIDSDSHNEETKVHFIQVNDTPEKILLFMAKNSKVVGLSATARINSVLSNYSIDYLKGELRDSFITLPKFTYKRLHSEQQEKWKAYTDGTVTLKVESVDKDNENQSVAERLRIIANNNDVAKNLFAKLNSLDLPENNQEYYQKRYCNVYMVLRSFIDNENIKSLLCLNMALPKENNPTFDIGLFELFVKQYCAVHGKEIPVLKVLWSGADFESNKDAVLKDLSDGKKVFVFSAYKTIGAGQNLQYMIPFVEKDKIITIFNRNGKTESEKDFDALYLGDVTNVIMNVNDVQKIDLKKLLTFLFEIKYLYENNEISPKDLNALVRAGFKAYSKKNDYSAPLDIVRVSASARKKITRDVIQAVGRLCRTSNKKDTIYIYTNNALLSSLDIHCVKSDLMNPELKELFKYASNYATPLPEEKIFIENEACRKSENANSYIKGILQRDWTERSIQLWKELRECVLKYPTASNDMVATLPAIRKFYIQNYERKSDYYFAQKGDFTDIRINLFQDFSAFQKGLDSDYKQNIGRVSEESARLQHFFVYKGLRDFFAQNGFATQFRNEELILSPVLFNNIYKGALGEVAGKFILDKELNTNLKELENPNNFEFFDFALADGIYIDFKHWKTAVIPNKDSLLNHIIGKLDAIGGKKAYIINILKTGDTFITTSHEKRIIEIPWLIDENGNPNKTAIQMIIGDMYDEN